MAKARPQRRPAAARRFKSNSAPTRRQLNPTQTNSNPTQIQLGQARIQLESNSPPRQSLIFQWVTTQRGQKREPARPLGSFSHIAPPTPGRASGRFEQTVNMIVGFTPAVENYFTNRCGRGPPPSQAMKRRTDLAVDLLKSKPSKLPSLSRTRRRRRSPEAILDKLGSLEFAGLQEIDGEVRAARGRRPKAARARAAPSLRAKRSNPFPCKPAAARSHEDLAAAEWSRSGLLRFARNDGAVSIAQRNETAQSSS